MKMLVYATLQFEAFHQWDDAPGEVAFLRARHRHIFHVRAEKAVTEDNRQVEFILLKREVQAVIDKMLVQGADIVLKWSCEQWAKFLVEKCNLTACEVSEDGENGARVEI